MVEQEKPLKNSQDAQENYGHSMAGEVHYFSPLAAWGLRRRFEEIVKSNWTTPTDTKPTAKN